MTFKIKVLQRWKPPMNDIMQFSLTDLLLQIGGPGKPEGKPRRAWMDNIKMHHRVDWIHLAQDREGSSEYSIEFSRVPLNPQWHGG
jgi:hypothetical protein